MSDNYIHKIDFEDLETFHTVLNMPRPNNSKSDIEHHFIMQEEAHPSIGFIKSTLSNIGAWWQLVRHHPAGQTRASIRHTTLKSHSLVRR
jgi:hypothetical protein